MICTALLSTVLAASPLSDATKRYSDLDYEGCVSVLAPAVGAMRGASRAQAELVLGLCQFALGREPEARRRIEAALRVDDDVKLPASASPKERELFDQVARFVAANPRAAPKHAPQPPAPKADPEPSAEKPPEPAPVEPAAEAPQPPPTPPPHVEAPPPPPRSFRLPIALSAVAVAGFAAAGTFGFLAQSTAAQGDTARLQVTAGALHGRAQTYALVANIAWGVAGAIALAAVITWLWSAL